MSKSVTKQFHHSQLQKPSTARNRISRDARVTDDDFVVPESNYRKIHMEMASSGLLDFEGRVRPPVDMCKRAHSKLISRNRKIMAFT
jgi:hypothetical protein